MGAQPYASDAEGGRGTLRRGDRRGSRMRAKSFTLYFLEGQDEFTVESKEIFETVFVEIAQVSGSGSRRRRPHRHGGQAMHSTTRSRCDAPRRFGRR
mgnify:CR=1 FL=1